MADQTQYTPPPPPKPRGFSCPKCGCPRLPRLYTRHRPASGAIVRVRKCKDCGHRIRTVERVESWNSPGKPAV